MPELLLELTVEEIPAAAQAPLAAQLASFLVKKLEEAHLEIDVDSVEIFNTPRRLIAQIENLPKQIPASTEQRKGPSEHAPKQAIAGFLKANNISKRDCELLPTPSAKDKGAKSWFLTTRKPATNLSEILPLWINEAIANLKPRQNRCRQRKGIFVLSALYARLWRFLMVSVCQEFLKLMIPKSLLPIALLGIIC